MLALLRALPALPCAAPVTAVPSAVTSLLANTVWSTPIPETCAQGFSGSDYLVFSSDTSKVTHNVIAIACTTCLPVLTETCTVSVRAAPNGWYDFNYTQTPGFGRFASGCISFRLLGATLQTTQVTDTQLCPPDGGRSGATGGGVSSSNWTREAAPGATATIMSTFAPARASESCSRCVSRELR